MASLTSILLLSVCVMSSASVIPESIVGLQSVSSTDDSPSIQELIIQSENTTDDSPAFLGMCPGGWELIDQRCFIYISTARTWAEAERFCLMLGGNLASVHSVAEYHYIQGLILAHTHGTPLTWIGGSDAQQEGIWFWSDASRFTLTLWGTGQPNNANNAEHCLHMNYGGNLVWDDRACSLPLPSICARRAS